MGKQYFLGSRIADGLWLFIRSR